ncbi:hypothetical protein NE237_011790 [Protea cynaroides]|uniref:Sugar transporter SWEET1 n=1 Tax=Protea cynaroides TaxID=273540 RepID=A0A9Q0JXE8_9MAGN|nr:hypothetical protein NE237_011790 [Protea cynaroides]
MLWMYYAFLKPNGYMLITINIIGCTVEASYITIYLIYASKEAKKVVVRTKSVEFMPFPLSFFLTLCAIMWFFYGLLMKDFYIALPNILGFTFGTVQMILYMIYKDAQKGLVLELKLPELDPKTYSSEDQENPAETVTVTNPGIHEKPIDPDDLNV